MNDLRIEGAKRLEQLGWALVRYARRVRRAEEVPSADHEASAAKWAAIIDSRLSLFVITRDLWKLQLGGNRDK